MSNRPNKHKNPRRPERETRMPKIAGDQPKPATPEPLVTPQVSRPREYELRGLRKGLTEKTRLTITPSDLDTVAQIYRQDYSLEEMIRRAYQNTKG
jgi:hypothetical protein